MLARVKNMLVKLNHFADFIILSFSTFSITSQPVTGVSVSTDYLQQTSPTHAAAELFWFRPIWTVSVPLPRIPAAWAHCRHHARQTHDVPAQKHTLFSPQATQAPGRKHHQRAVTHDTAGPASRTRRPTPGFSSAPLF